MNKKIETKLNQNKNNFKGFTIIEVVLVLAIAGLIFLMVFLGLPALQRAQRDTQRKQDVAMVVTALHQWKAANQGRGYSTLGDSTAVPNNSVDEDDKKYDLVNTITSIKNSPLNNYIGFKQDNSNRNDSSSSLSLNTSSVTTFVYRGSNAIRLGASKDSPFANHKSIIVVIDFGCTVENLKDGSTILKGSKPGTAAVLTSLESGGAYCQEA